MINGAVMMHNQKVAVIGLGYVGLPLALAFGRVMPTVGFDLSGGKVRAYIAGDDPSGEMVKEQFKQATHLSFSTDEEAISDADFIIVAVPTPVDNAHSPDLMPVIKASELVGRQMKKGAIVVFESTVYPGVTEDICVPVLEHESGFAYGKEFKIGYSPERVNPGDKVHRLEQIVKVVAGQDDETLMQVAVLYEQVIEAGVHRSPSIKVAEAAKVIENTQRDLNIALMNELAVIFNKMGIDTLDVLEAAGTKWNFLPFRPGLVGGHCIGVDPYYLTYKAETLGYYPDVILAGRHINDGMGKYIAEQAVKQMITTGCNVSGARILILGLTFKENCGDLRNSRVIDIILELKSYGLEISVSDPLANAEDAKDVYGVDLIDYHQYTGFDAVIVAVAHDALVSTSPHEFAAHVKDGALFMDVKSAFDRDELASAGFHVWRL